MDAKRSCAGSWARAASTATFRVSLSSSRCPSTTSAFKWRSPAVPRLPASSCGGMTWFSVSPSAPPSASPVPRPSASSLTRAMPLTASRPCVSSSFASLVKSTATPSASRIARACRASLFRSPPFLALRALPAPSVVCCPRPRSRAWMSSHMITCPLATRASLAARPKCVLSRLKCSVNLSLIRLFSSPAAGTGAFSASGRYNQSHLGDAAQQSRGLAPCHEAAIATAT
mmetsp:Transcript_9861/g.31521  ORF Transcript_9861/g.31521 Transcript_9861/m.31521 type:complete len:229 (+) Transcript_9861:654-1340(+)